MTESKQVPPEYGMLLMKRDNTCPVINLIVQVERRIFSVLAAIIRFEEHSRRNDVITSFNKSGLISSEHKSASNLSAMPTSSKMAFSDNSFLQMLSRAVNEIGFGALSVRSSASLWVRRHFAFPTSLVSSSALRFRLWRDSDGIHVFLCLRDI